MKKNLLFFLLTLSFTACSNSQDDMPKLELVGVSLNGSGENLIDDFEQLFPLQAKDELDLVFILNGNGTDLKTFMMVKESGENINIEMLFAANDISDEFTELPKWVLGYRDGIRETQVTVRAKIDRVSDTPAKLSFYLFSKSPNCEGACVDIIVTTSDEKPVTP